MSESGRDPVRCPVCHVELRADELHALHLGNAEALDRLRAQHERELAERSRQLEGRLAEAEERRNKDLERVDAETAESFARLRKQGSEAMEELKQMLNQAHRNQILTAEQAHAESLEQLRRDLAGAKERQLAWEKEREALRAETSQRELAAQERARAEWTNEVARRDQQIQELRLSETRLNEQFEQLRESLHRSPSDVVGEAGEFLLQETLESAFPQDQVQKISKPGQKSADVLQRIARAPGVYTPTVLVYDNKVGKKVTAKDLSSARTYREIHGTDHVLVVTDEMPTGMSDRLVAEADGILIVKRVALTALVEVLRRQVIKLDLARASGAHRDRKESLLFDYVRGDEFNRNLKRLLALDLKEHELLETEKRSHLKMWKQREDIHREREEAVSQVESSTSAILERESLTSNPELDPESVEKVRADLEAAAPSDPPLDPAPEAGGDASTRRRRRELQATLEGP